MKNLASGLVLRNSRPKDGAALEALQRAAFPTLSAADLLSEAHFRSHIFHFPEGQFAIFDGETLAASTSTMRCEFDFEHADHTFLEFSGYLTFSTHDPRGAWLYGGDMAVAEIFRGQGLARELYRARQELCQKMGMKGQVIVGMPIGFDRFRSEMDIETYFEKLKKGEIHDPTVGVQRRMGFEIVSLVKNYLADPACANAGVLMVLEAEKVV